MEIIEEEKEEYKIIKSEIVNIQPDGVCCKKITVKIGVTKDKEYILENILFFGGCSGNLSAISKIIKGQKITDIITVFSGNICGIKETSCVDQLAKNLQKFLDNKKVS